MKLYENVVIGNFLYGLGVSIGGRIKTDPIPGAISLLQQTPEDKALGDVLIAFPGIIRLIEFKAKGNTSTKEKSRYSTLKIAMGAKELAPHPEDVSRRVHWFVETAPNSQSGVETFFSSYIDAFDGKEKSRKSYVLEEFINAVADEAFTPHNEKKAREDRDYLKLVRWSQGVGETGASALIVVVGAGGMMRFVALEDLMELNLSHGKWLEYRHQMEIDKQHMELNNHNIKHEKQKEYEYEMERGQSYGM